MGLYLDRRGMLGSIEKFGLGYEAGFLVVPIKGRGGEVQGLIRRAYPETERKTGKRYMIPTGQQAMMYVPDWGLWDTSEVSYVTFGILDAMSLAVAGLGAASPTNGKLSFDPKWVDDIRHKIVVVPDRGEEKDAHDLAARLDWRGHAGLLDYQDDEKDPNDILVRRGADGLKEALYAASGSIGSIGRTRTTKQAERRGSRPGHSRVSVRQSGKDAPGGRQGDRHSRQRGDARSSRGKGRKS
jgi:hypothetical protein